MEPGRICRDFLSGRRVPWMHPFKYSVLTGAFAFLVQRGVFGLQAAPTDEGQAIAQQIQSDYGQVLNCLLMPVVALAMRWLFPRVGLRWIEHLVVTMYGFGHLFLIQTCFMPLLVWGGFLEQAVTIAVVCLPFGYFTWLAVQTWGSRWWRALPRVVLMWVGCNAVLNLALNFGVQAFR